MAKIYLVRHPESIDNKNSIFSGDDRDFGLSENGIKQAHELKDFFRNIRVDRIYSSPLKRCTQSVDIIFEGREEIPVIIDERIKERSYGWFEGKSKVNLGFFGRLIKRVTYRSYWIAPPLGGESFRQIWKRVMPFVLEVEKIARENKENIFICGHHNSNRPIRAYFENKTIKQLLKDKSQDRDVKIYNLE